VIIKKGLILMLLVASLALVGCGQGTSRNLKEPLPQKEPKVSLMLSVAASLRDSMQEITIMYQNKEPNVELVLNLGSSGALQQQIEHGAPVDIFISAASKQMNELEKKACCWRVQEETYLKTPWFW